MSKQHEFSELPSRRRWSTCVLTVRQAVFVLPAVAAVADQRGFFADHDVDVQTTSVPSSHAQLADLLEDRADVAITAIDNLFAWNSTGADLVVIAQIESVTPLALLLRPGLDSINDLDVVRLGVDASTNGFAVVAYAMMARAGRDASGYEVVEVGGVSERFEALGAGSIDATLVAAPLDEIGQQRGMKVAMRVGELAPAYPGLGVVARRALVETSSASLAGYLGALAEALVWMRASTNDEVAGHLTGVGFGHAAVQSVMSTLPSSLAPSPASLDVLLRLREQVDMVIPDAPHPREIVDGRVLVAAGLPFPTP
jgi:ABC-type nitrate/sulfonate/bicarbonate transport system substrate-binding protein